ncbi:MAG: hypothetical protein JO126_04120 [Alphaproteobacteria bacterium]|nr:hypothetical protein [Alphaproteobacteria bacterium]MBV8548625.1 hypothetical protein [Alphaproteobacteria bacterium]
MSHTPVIAAVVDIGSNGVRLVVFHVKGSVHQIIHEERCDCRLAEGLAGSKPKLSQHSMQKALKALKEFSKSIARFEPSVVTAVATAAIRSVADTKQGKAFHTKAEKALGYPIRIISGVTEARYTAQGVLTAFPKAIGLCVDMGGGSLELAYVSSGKVRQTSTLPLGSLTLSMRTKGDPLLREVLLDHHLEKNPILRKAKGKTIFATGGSWRAMARLLMRARGMRMKSIHGYKLSAKTAYKPIAEIAMESPKKFKKLNKKISQRAETLPAAAAAMLKIFEYAQPKDIVFSSYGIRNGALLAALRSDTEHH